MIRNDIIVKDIMSLAYILNTTYTSPAFITSLFRRHPVLCLGSVLVWLALIIWLPVCPEVLEKKE